MQIESSQNMQLVTAAVMASLEFVSEGLLWVYIRGINLIHTT